MKKEKRKGHNISELVETTGWLQRLGVAGFVFFLAKGLLWVVAVAWVTY